MLFVFSLLGVFCYEHKYAGSRFLLVYLLCSTTFGLKTGSVVVCSAGSDSEARLEDGCHHP